MRLLSFITFLTLLNSELSSASIKAFTNHNPNSSYTEPYRPYTRPGDNLEKVVVDQIKLAQKSVFVAVQELRLPEIAKALIEKKQQGLDVRVVLEHDYNFNVLDQRDTSSTDEHDASRLAELRAFVDLNDDGKFDRNELMQRDAIFMLKSAGVKIMDDTFDGSRGSGLMHHKFVIIDKATTLVSTANFTMSCIHGDIINKNTRGNPNSIVVIESSEVAGIFDTEFKQLWGNGKRGNFGQNKTYRGAQVADVDGRKITIQFSPTSARYTWEESVNGLIAEYLKSAKDSINAALFVYSDQKISDQLEKVHNRGVDLGFLVEAKFAFRNYSELLDMMGLEMLSMQCSYESDNWPWNNKSLRAGIPRLYVGDVLHHKFAVIDNETVIMGSQNWSEAANYTNDETLIVIEDAKLAPFFTQEYMRLEAISAMGPSDRLLAEIERLEDECTDPNIQNNQALTFPFQSF